MARIAIGVSALALPLCVMATVSRAADIRPPSGNEPYIKPPLVGLISMGRAGFGKQNRNADYDGIPDSSVDDIKAKQNAFSGIVINIPWKQIQPDRENELVPAAIDEALEDIARYNADPATVVPLRAILRVWAGANAPDWAKQLGGRPATVFGRRHGTPGQSFLLGRFWSADYRAAFRSLQEKLAHRYDANPLIAQISDTSCTSSDDEPMAVPRYASRSDGISSIVNLKAAGYTDSLFVQCVIDGLDDYSAWRRTSVNLTLNAVFELDRATFGPPPKNLGLTMYIIKAFRAKFGARAVLANHNLSYPPMKAVEGLYDALSAAGGQLEFQTRSPRNLDWPATIKYAVQLGAEAVELWNATPSGGYKDIPPAQLRSWSASFVR